MSDNGEKLLYSRDEAAMALNISPRKLDLLIAFREIPVRRIGRRVLLHRETLDRFARGETDGTLAAAGTGGKR